MTAMSPTVSVIVPTYNRQPYLIESLASIFSQTYLDYEVLVVDDGSTDGTSEWLQIQYPQVKLIQHRENRGAAAARNAAITQARGQFIAFLDTDDQWLPQYLHYQIAALKQQPHRVLAYCNYISIIAGQEASPKEGVRQTVGRLISLKPLYHDLIASTLLANFIHTLSQVVVPMSVFQKIGLLDERLLGCHDKEFYLRAFALGQPIQVEEYLVKKYWLPDSIVTSNHCQNWLANGLKMLDIFYSKPENSAYLPLRKAAERSLRYRVKHSEQFFSSAFSSPSEPSVPTA
jgi:glycosyltransferase involved in cell wall biosynthesis